MHKLHILASALILLLASCVQKTTAEKKSPATEQFHKPLITHMFTADPSAHVFNEKLYIYPSHDTGDDTPPDNNGSQYNMVDYHVFSMDSITSTPKDHGRVLHVDDVPWAAKQMWAPDAAFINNRYVLYFPAKDSDGIFRIGAAVSTDPEGPFTPEPSPIPGSFSMDPAVFVDDDGTAWMLFGGLWGGQLEKWQTGTWDPDGKEPGFSDPALGPYIAKLSADGLTFDGEAAPVTLLDSAGKPVKAGDKHKRFFEAAWMHKHNGTYYLSWSTGDTHKIVYATGNNPAGPFTFRGIVLLPVTGWTTHHSIVEYQEKWYLFYHDCTLSEGIDHKRNIKMSELVHNPDGTIETINPYPED